MANKGWVMWALAMSAAVLLLAACARGGAGQMVPGVRVDVALAPDPPHVGPATVTVTLEDEAGRPLTGAMVELEGDMSHAGMVPVLAQAAESAPGLYEAPLEFTMPGDWVLSVRATLADGRVVKHEVALPGIKNE